MRTIFIILACLAFAPVVSGCHGTASEYCDLKCDCEKCSDNKYDECIINYEAGMDAANAYGCTERWDDLHACAMDNHGCALNIFSADLVACGDEGVSLARCTDDNSALH